MNTTIASTLLAFTLTALPLVVGCSADASAPTNDEQSVIAAPPEVKIWRDLTSAIVGLETHGGDSDPDAYEIASLRIDNGATVSDANILEGLLPQFNGVVRDDGTPAFEERPSAEAWAKNTAEPNAADYSDDPLGLARAKDQAAKWRAVKKIFDENLIGVRFVDVGYKRSENGTIETGAVARVVVGTTANGHVFAVWGIDVWT